MLELKSGELTLEDVFIKLTEQREEREIQLAAGAKRESEEKKS